ncbi:hypothetical protein ABZY09_48830 [Streptomyces sp. NPDC002928]|uniref:hypothetical protein n=1 Tax=Streptomyces sp. NPDC002928 TaxID=3154440 RepID=UPI0033BB1A9E
MGHEGPYLQLRPLSGGREWDADPGHVLPLTPAELLHARLVERNARSRRNLCANEPNDAIVQPPPQALAMSACLLHRIPKS